LSFFIIKICSNWKKPLWKIPHLKPRTWKLKQSQSDLDLVRKFLPMELQSLVVRARELASGGDSGGTKHTAEPTPTADLTTYKRPKYK
jgi:hypothetical protein